MVQTQARPDGTRQQALLPVRLDGFEPGETPRLALRLPLGFDLDARMTLAVASGATWAVPDLLCSAGAWIATTALREAELRALTVGQGPRIADGVEGVPQALDISAVGLQAGRGA